MCLVTFIVPLIFEQIATKITFDMKFDEKYYQSRIDSIVMMVCDGILVKDAYK